MTDILVIRFRFGLFPKLQDVIQAGWANSRYVPSAAHSNNMIGLCETHLYHEDEKVR